MSKEQFENKPEEKEKTDPVESVWDEEGKENMDDYGAPKKKLPPKKFGEWKEAA